MDKSGGAHVVVWDGVVDTRVGERAFVLFWDGSSSLVLSQHFIDAVTKSVIDLSAAVPPTCILAGCDNPISQGLCPSQCGRKTACSFEHYNLAVENEGFVHPGFIRPGVKLTSSPAFRRALTRTRDSSLTLTGKRPLSTETPKPKTPMSVAARIEHSDSIVRASTAAQRPTAWMESLKTIDKSSVDFISIFDGRQGTINKTAHAFGFVGLPPVDIANTTMPVDL